MPLEIEGTHPCNYRDEGGCSVCGLTEEVFEDLLRNIKVIPIPIPKEIKWNKDTIR